MQNDKSENVPNEVQQERGVKWTRMIVLRNGVSVSFAALKFAWELESRGVTVCVRDTGCLSVTPTAMLTAADGRAIRAYEAELLSLARYCDSSQEQ